MKWKPISNAPKEKVVLLNIGLPYPVIGILTIQNVESLKNINYHWVYASIAVDECYKSKMHNDEYSFCFENEWCDIDYPIGWMDFPEL